MRRRTALQLLASTAAWPWLASSGLAVERDVPWLHEIQIPPAPNDRTPVVSDLLEHDGQRITTLEEWLARADELRAWWLNFLGPAPAQRHGPPEYEVLLVDQWEGIIRTVVRYEVEPNVFTDACICRPATSPGTMPGILALHSTVTHSIFEPAALTLKSEYAFGTNLARQGYTVLCPRTFTWPENGRLSVRSQLADLKARHPQTLAMRKMLHDCQVAIDLLASLNGVDPQRLGAVGHSLGAKQALYVTAFDERVRVAAACEGGVGIRSSNWDAPWYLKSSVVEPTFTHDHHELLGLIAPRPYLIVGGDAADGDHSWPYVERALPIYRLHGKQPRCGLFNHRQGHAVTRSAAERIDQWFDTYL